MVPLLWLPYQKQLYHLVLAFLFVRRLSTVGLLCSPVITPVPCSYEPIGHPLVFDPLPAINGYRIYLPPEISPWDEEGFSSCVVCPCHHAIALTPPEWTIVSARIRLPILPSPPSQRFGLRGFSLSRLPLRSLSLWPGDSLTIPCIALSMGFKRSVSLPFAIQATRSLTLTLAGLTPAEHISLRWTHNLARMHKKDMANRSFVLPALLLFLPSGNQKLLLYFSHFITLSLFITD